MFGVEDEGLVGFVPFCSAVDCTGGSECAVGDDFSKAHGLIVFGGGVLVPHPDDDLLGTDEDLLGEGFGVAGAGSVICEELLINSFGPCFWYLIICGAGCRRRDRW